MPHSNAQDACGDLRLTHSWRKHLGLVGQRCSCTSKREQACVEIWIAPIETMVRPGVWDKVLHPAEAEAVAYVRSQSARDSFVAGRALLRLALSHAVSARIAPPDWELHRLPSGKLDICDGFPQIYSSISHTERIAVVAVSEKLAVGVDAESTEQSVEREVAAYFCCRDEQAFLNALPPRHSMREMIRLWTLKEAYTKLRGSAGAVDFSGLGFSLDTFRLMRGSGFADEAQTRFETMFVSTGNGLSHISLAIAPPADVAVEAELRVITLAESNPPALHVPCISLSGAAPHMEPT